MSGDYRKLSDEDLVSRFSETQADDCFSEIVRRFQPRVRAGAYAVLRDRSLAQDVSQDSFLRLLMNGQSFRGGSFAAWLQTVTRNLSLSLLKRSLREEPSEDGVLDAICANPDDTALRAQLEETLAQLPPPQRMCLLLLCGEGYSYKQIARLTGFSERQVKSHIQNGRRNFEQRWKGRPVTD